MPGLLLQDSGFSLENGTKFSLANTFCSQDPSTCSFQQDEVGTEASSAISSDSLATNACVRGCLNSSGRLSRTVPRENKCNNPLMTGVTTHALSFWSPPSIDVSNVNDDLRVAGFQDYETVWPDIDEEGTENTNLSGDNNGIMLGSFFCDLHKDVARRTAPFSSEGSPGGSPTLPTVASPLSKCLKPSANDDCWSTESVYCSDEFRMFEFKVRRCTRGRSHDWTECPFAHPGERARRRDPRRCHYSGTACPDFRKGNCKRGDACEFAHGVFECWLHPARYRTQPCKDGRSCTRRVCFFAHTPEQLRLLPVANSALRMNVSCNLHSDHQNPLLSDQNISEDILANALLSEQNSNDIFDEIATSFDMLRSTGSFDGSHSLHMGSPGVRHKICTSSFTASPTSTLACIPLSPPNLSPPISPSLSPASLRTWHGHPVSPALPIAATGFPLLSSSRSSFPRVQALFAQAQTDTSSLSFIPVHKSAPSFSVQSSIGHVSIPSSFPSYAHPNLYKSFSSAPASPSGIPSSRNTPTDLVTAMQQLDLKNVHHIWFQHSTSPHATVPSPLSRASNTISSSDNVWCSDVFEEDSKLQRVESGKALRAQFYGKIAESGKQLEQEESPDLGWVNDLVLE